ncbi:MAG: lamin tail domain-containing protein [Anaerolineales bacterium]|nr:lamin tail domain-containing protein [Anaerolineales bacterium]
MSQGKIAALILTLVLLLTSCTSTLPDETHILISELKTGAPGDNNDEFIELYNPGDQALDLEGWSITYTLNEEEKDLPVILWQSTLLIPPHGHILLVRSGGTNQAAADAVFEQPLNTFFGALTLLDTEGCIVDGLGWGTIPPSAAEEKPAPAPEDGYSLERKPGRENGSTQDTNNNEMDFVLREQPDPQSSGSAFTPASEPVVEMILDGPGIAEPGSTITYHISVTNLSDQSLQDLRVVFPLDPSLETIALPQGAVLKEDTIVWPLESLASSQTAGFNLQAALPWSYDMVSSMNARLLTSSGDILDFAGSLHTSVQGGTLPIQLARTMLNEEVTVEGTATMYTGGFYAGSGAKFYMQDASGGVQVYVSGAGGVLEVPIGASVRVRGTAMLYNNAVEIVPGSAADVEILSADYDDIQPIPLSISELLNAPDIYTGQLVEIEAQLTAIEEFSYSYEIDMTGDNEETLGLYVDKLTEINVDGLDTGFSYRVTGIPEWRSTTLFLNPRLDSDFAEVFAAGVLIEAGGPNTVLPGEEALVSLTVTNHLSDPIDNVIISIAEPAQGGVVTRIKNDGKQDENGLYWALPSLSGGGESASVSYAVRAENASEIRIASYQASYDGAAESVLGPDFTVYVGNAVPVWAVQGDTESSPYKQQSLSTQGVVTGVFPELGGFFIQDPEGDGSADTSDGLFIIVENTGTLSAGDVLTVTGVVSESSSQTQLVVSSAADIVVEQHGSALPEAVPYGPPESETAALVYNETLEGMLVSASGPHRVVAPTSQYGEFSLVPDDYPGERVWRTDPAGMMITIDDGSNVTHTDRSTLPYVVTTGDLVSDLIGPLAYTYGKYKIEPILTPTIEAAELPLPELVLPENGFSLMTWNVENLFDILSPHPSSPAMPTIGQYRLEIKKVAGTIRSAGYPTLIALQEVENIGILEDIAAEDVLASYHYQPYLVEGKDSRGIDVGYLVRADMVSAVRVEQRDAPGEVFSRPPLLLQADLNTPSGEKLVVSILNNHFLSLSEGEVITEQRRTAQASWNAGIVQKMLDTDSDASIAVLGDLNSFYNTAPLEALKAAGLTHLYNLEGMEQNYTYIYQGLSESLDHILISSGLEALFEGFSVLHVNADYPPPIPGDPSPMRASDHDPIIAWFVFP